MKLSKRKEKAQKKCVPEDPESDPASSDSPSSEFDSSYGKNTANIKARDAKKMNMIRNARNRTC